MKLLFSFFLFLSCSGAHAAGLDYLLNGITTPVKVDTVTPANSRLYPFSYYNILGVQTDIATEATLSALNTKVNSNFGAATGGIRTNAQVGNATGAADFGSGNLSAQTLRTVIATDQPAIPTQSPVNTTGTYAEIVNLTTVAQTFTAPANAVGFLIETDSTNTVNVRMKVGAVATVSSGVQLQPGRSEYLPLGANISVITESGSAQKVYVQWVGK